MNTPMPASGWPAGTIFTIGHSTLSQDVFAAVLEAYGVERLADIRTIPRSRHNPQFNADALAEGLVRRGICYEAMPALGGLRHARKDSPNAGWRNSSFRGYADYMQTDAFAAALDTLMRIARQAPTAIMCAEAVPWRCHRSLVADALLIRGIEVVDILSATEWRAHRLTSFAKVEGLRITYPPDQPSLL